MLNELHEGDTGYTIVVSGSVKASMVSIKLIFRIFFNHIYVPGNVDFAVDRNVFKVGGCLYSTIGGDVKKISS